MATLAAGPTIRSLRNYRQWLPDLELGFQNLLQHRLRTMLTMLGMIFGVAAVVSMLSIILVTLTYGEPRAFGDDGRHQECKIRVLFGTAGHSQLRNGLH